jgi:hypothetical protein
MPECRRQRCEAHIKAYMSTSSVQGIAHLEQMCKQVLYMPCPEGSWLT